MKTIRIGSGAGYGGDRLEPAIELIRKGNLDYIIFECLAERTIALGQLAKKHDPKAGYNSLLEYRMKGILEAIKEHPVKVITNMGSANPQAAAEITAAMAKDAGLKGLKIACVSGDDVLGILPSYMDETVMETGEPLSSLADSIVSANAYLGAPAIVEALKAGADIIITGRVADPSLVVAPLMYEFGWKKDDWDLLGKGTIAGHLLECAGQVTGGYFADPGVKDVPDLWNLGFPIAIVGEDGSLEITKLEDAGGCVTTDTVKEQILYEIQDPSCYPTPDCCADFKNVRVEQLGKDRVGVYGVSGNPNNGKYKLSIGYQDCWIGEGQISYCGSTAKERAELAGEIVKKRLEVRGCRYSELRIELMGVNSLYGWEDSSSLREVRLRAAARTADKANADIIGQEVEALYTNGPGGGGGATKSSREVISVASILIPQDAVKTKVEITEV